MSVYPVIMCGGSGTRLWPASRPTRPKQFVPLTGDRSSFQETVLRVLGLADAVRPLIVAGAAHEAAIVSQLAEIGVAADLLLEPEPRDSAAAMAAAATWIAERDPAGVAVVVSADHDVPDAQAFRVAMDTATKAAQGGRIVTLGVRPTAPSAAYGYLQPEGGEGVQALLAFVEKPDATKAAAYVEAGYLWNSGNFVVSAQTLVDELSVHAPDVLAAAQGGVTGSTRTASGAQLLGPIFRTAPKISIDYAVMEKTRRASVLPVAFAWSDVGAWDAVLGASPRDAAGNASSGDVMLFDAKDSYVRASAGRRVAAIGVSNVAIIADGDDVLVCDLDHAQTVKAAADGFKRKGPARSDFASLGEAASWYRRWLMTNALPLWWSLGADHDLGGFIEALSVDGDPRPAARRGRVQGRQVYVFTTAGELGWAGPWKQAAAHGLDYAFKNFQRPDGLFRKLVAVDGKVLDDGAAVYDQAFALLGMAMLHQVGGYGRDLRAEALRTRAALETMRDPKAGFRETDDHPNQSNCHMHILEASLAWVEAGESDWGGLADEIAEMALSTFIDAEGGFLREFFDKDWKPAAGDDGRRVEPGHQFEWSWLMSRWGRLRGRQDALDAARRLFEYGKQGVDDRGIAINALWDDLTVWEPEARLWPQTEYMKAALALGEDVDVLAAANGLKLYLETPAAGVWYDKLRPDGTFLDEPAPASSFYHIICAITELSRFQAARS
ncbi:AGE family epimerase/isomerase [Phenylobacterium sp. 20VBR1]|uniref:AGE family epimerase/isomerase n=1 Tax=Phenylobacterium glaciei TaxID=2803784 RepID=A0A941D1Q6_9CAUL|nr:AGE family epimerase/isomerase [Phenylobacterium glaciei]MBR7619241.1 AGE family epimerase/isomerase [Phenylobacterium glaciei]